MPGLLPPRQGRLENLLEALERNFPILGCSMQGLMGWQVASHLQGYTTGICSSTIRVIIR